MELGHGRNWRPKNSATARGRESERVGVLLVCGVRTE